MSTKIRRAMNYVGIIFLCVTLLNYFRMLYNGDVHTNSLDSLWYFSAYVVVTHLGLIIFLLVSLRDMRVHAKSQD